MVFAAKLKPPTDFSYFVVVGGGDDGGERVFARGYLALNRPEAFGFISRANRCLHDVYTTRYTALFAIKIEIMERISPR